MSAYTVCTNCNKPTNEVLTREDDVVCLECGMVKDRLFRLECDDLVCFHPVYAHHYMLVPGNRSGTRYRHLFHLNEVLAQICRTGPTIPPDIMELIQAEAAKKEIYGLPKYFGQAHIRKILRSVEVPEQISEKYRSEPRAQNRYKSVPLVSLARYVERWRWILSQIDQERKIPLPGINLVMMIRDAFDPLRIAFLRVCNRRHMIHYGYIFMKILQHLDHRDGTNVAPTFAPWIPVPSPETCRNLDKVMGDMCEHTGIYFEITKIFQSKVKFGDKSTVTVNFFFYPEIDYSQQVTSVSSDSNSFLL